MSTEGPSPSSGGQTTTFEPSPAIASANQGKKDALTFVLSSTNAAALPNGLGQHLPRHAWPRPFAGRDARPASRIAGQHSVWFRESAVAEPNRACAGAGRESGAGGVGLAREARGGQEA